MDDTPPPDALLSQSLAVLRHCLPTLETAAARAPHVAAELQETLTALRGVDRAGLGGRKVVDNPMDVVVARAALLALPEGAAKEPKEPRSHQGT